MINGVYLASCSPLDATNSFGVPVVVLLWTFFAVFGVPYLAVTSTTEFPGHQRQELALTTRQGFLCIGVVVFAGGTFGLLFVVKFAMEVMAFSSVAPIPRDGIIMPITIPPRICGEHPRTLVSSGDGGVCGIQFFGVVFDSLRLQGRHVCPGGGSCFPVEDRGYHGRCIPQDHPEGYHTSFGDRRKHFCLCCYGSYGWLLSW